VRFPSSVSTSPSSATDSPLSCTQQWMTWNVASADVHPTTTRSCIIEAGRQARLDLQLSSEALSLVARDDQ